MFGDILKSGDLPDFLWKPGEYEAIGVRVAIKVRRQVNSGRKLLCNCPVADPSPDYDVEVSRHLRPDADYGDVLPIEPGCSREVVYRLSRKTACTYEMDDSPPMRLNMTVLSGAKALARSMGCILPAMTRVMREQWLDGSIPSGFQRSIMIGWDCDLPFLKKRLEIQRVTLAEDTARLVEDNVTRRVFMTDRLGIPLLVITTKASLQTPGQVAAAACLLRMVTAVMPGAMHGQDALRFDALVSIKGGGFIEIRDFQGVEPLIAAVHYEVARQKQQGNPTMESGRSRGQATTVPGPARRLHLPETDMPAIRLDCIEDTLPRDMPWKSAENMEKQGIPKEQVRALLARGAVNAFKQLTGLGIQPVTAAWLALQYQLPDQAKDLVKATKIAMEFGKDPVEQKKMIMRMMQDV